MYTAFQLLDKFKRVPKSNARPILVSTPFGEYYYYKLSDSFEVSKTTNWCLKRLYIKKFNGWEKIDLAHSDYDGKIWWDKSFTTSLEGKEKQWNYSEDTKTVIILH